MSEYLYFSEREEGEVLRDRPEISREFWGGFVALVHRLIADGSLAQRFPLRTCPDVPAAVVGCDSHLVGDAFRGENPTIPWPLQAEAVPPTLQAIDAVQFFWGQVSEPQWPVHHGAFAHYHFLDFNSFAAQTNYRDAVNRLFRRNRHPYELEQSGDVRIIGSPVLTETLSGVLFKTGDSDLDRLLESARTKFRDPDPVQRRESLEKLWDAWERLKTLYDPDKRAFVQRALQQSVLQKQCRERIDKEALELTDIGNSFMIRHYEQGKIPIEGDDLVSYLFHRMFALIWLFLKVTGKLQ